MDATVRQAFEASFGQVFSESGLGGATLSPARAEEVGAESIFMVGIAGAFRGYLILSIGDEDLHGLCRRLTLAMCGPGAPHDPTLSRSAAAEFANELGGRAAALLSGRGFDCTITPPTVIHGTGIEAVISGFDESYAWEATAEGLRFGITVLSKKS